MNWKTERKRIWAVNRAILENDIYKHGRSGIRKRSHWTEFEEIVIACGYVIRGMGLYDRGFRNAMDVQIQNVTIEFFDLPKNFHNYKILHLTDLHLDCVPKIENVIVERIQDLNFE